MSYLVYQCRECGELKAFDMEAYMPLTIRRPGRGHWHQFKRTTWERESPAEPALERLLALHGQEVT